jgi:hypothetical protein
LKRFLIIFVRSSESKQLKTFALHAMLLFFKEDEVQTAGGLVSVLQDDAKRAVERWYPFQGKPDT